MDVRAGAVAVDRVAWRAGGWIHRIGAQDTVGV